MARAFGDEVLYTREGGCGPEADLADVPRRAGGLPRRRPARRPDPRAEREGRDPVAAQGCRGGGAPVGELAARRGCRARDHRVTHAAEPAGWRWPGPATDRAAEHRARRGLARGGLGRPGDARAGRRRRADARSTDDRIAADCRRRRGAGRASATCSASTPTASRTSPSTSATLPGRRIGGASGRPARVGALLADRDAGLLVHAVALANWHATHRRCPRCGDADRGRGRPATSAAARRTAASTTRAPTRP